MTTLDFALSLFQLFALKIVWVHRFQDWMSAFVQMDLPFPRAVVTFLDAMRVRCLKLLKHGG